MPFVKQDLYREIAAHLPEGEREKAEQVRVTADAAPGDGGEGGDVTTFELPEDWASLKVGHMMLAKEGAGGPWYEAVIVAVYGNDSVRLRWRDYDDEAPFTRRLAELAMLHPAYVEA